MDPQIAHATPLVPKISLIDETSKIDKPLSPLFIVLPIVSLLCVFIGAVASLFLNLSKNEFEQSQNAKDFETKINQQASVTSYSTINKNTDFRVSIIPTRKPTSTITPTKKPLPTKTPTPSSKPTATLVPTKPTASTPTSTPKPTLIPTESPYKMDTEPMQRIEITNAYGIVYSVAVVLKKDGVLVSNQSDITYEWSIDNNDIAHIVPKNDCYPGVSAPCANMYANINWKYTGTARLTVKAYKGSEKVAETVYDLIHKPQT